MQDQNTPVSEPQVPTVGFPTSTTPSEEKKGFSLLIPVVLLLLVVFGGIGFFIFKSSKSAQEEPTPAPSLTKVVDQVPTPTPQIVQKSPVPTPLSVDRAKIKVQILNGTGTPGDAGSVQNALASLGYKIIETGNATSTDATKTTVTFDSSLSDSVATEVTAKLKGIFKDVTSKSAKLADFQIEIITGPKKTSSVTTTASPSAIPTATKSPTPSASPSASPAI